MWLFGLWPGFPHSDNPVSQDLADLRCSASGAMREFPNNFSTHRQTVGGDIFLAFTEAALLVGGLAQGAGGKGCAGRLCKQCLLAQEKSVHLFDDKEHALQRQPPLFRD
jgi:hypothetical protein